jgi:uncharacterized protein involved in exopolysaccharide biosynthesis
MSFLATKPSIDETSSLPARANRPASSPVFRPEFMRSLRMHPVAAAVVASIVCLILIAYGLRMKPMYEAQSLVYVQPSAVKPLADDTGGLFDVSRYESYISQQVETAGRQDILMTAIRSLPAGTWQLPGESEASAARRLQKAVKVARVQTSYQLSFTLLGPNPARTSATLNAVVAAYLAAGRKDEIAESDERARILEQERQRLTTVMTQDRTEQAQLASSLGMANPGTESDNPYDSQLTALRAELASAREAHDMAQAQLGSVTGSDSAHASGLSSAADEIIGGDAGLSSMRSSVGQRRAVLTGQMAGLTPANPLYKQDQEELAGLDKSQDAMTRELRDKAAHRLQDKLRTDLARTGDVESRLNAELAQQTAQATTAAPRLQRAGELTSDLQRLEARYAIVDGNLRTLQLEDSGPGLARLALAATPPLAPEPSRRNLVLAAALPFGILCGLFAAVFLRKRDRHLYVALDLDNVLGFTPIAVLPAEEEVSAAVMSEYMLRLAGGIEDAYRKHGARTFVFTAAGQGSGLHNLAAPLNRQMRDLGMRTVTVSAQEILHGLLAGEAQSDSHGLELADTARKPESRNEGFAGTNLDLLKRRYDIVFLECSPLLTSAETEYLVRCADAAILFVESGSTTRDELLRSALLLEQLQVKGIGTVLENLHLKHADPAFRLALAELERRQSSQRTPAPTRTSLVSGADAVPVQTENRRLEASMAAEPGSSHRQPQSSATAYPASAEESTGQPSLTPSERDPGSSDAFTGRPGKVRVWEERADGASAPGPHPGPFAAAPASTHVEPPSALILANPDVCLSPDLPKARSSARMAVHPESASVTSARTSSLQEAGFKPVGAARAVGQPSMSPAMENAAARQATGEARRPRAAAEPLRTGRWDPIPPLRAQATPWRDRRVPGSDAHIDPSQDRRFRSGSPAMRKGNSTPEPIASVEPSPPLAARPQLVPREPNLTRRWGLLSQFGGNEVQSETMALNESQNTSETPAISIAEQRAAAGNKRP